MSAIRVGVDLGTKNRLSNSNIFEDERDNNLLDNVLAVVLTRLQSTPTHRLLHTDANGHVLEILDCCPKKLGYTTLTHIHMQHHVLVRNVRIVPSKVRAREGGVEHVAGIDLQVELGKYSSLPPFDAMDVDAPVSRDMAIQVSYKGAARHLKQIQPLVPKQHIPEADLIVLQTINHYVHHMSERMPVLTTECQTSGMQYRLRYSGLHKLDSMFMSWLVFSTVNFIVSLSCKAELSPIPGLEADGDAPRTPTLRLTVCIRRSEDRANFIYDASTEARTMAARVTAPRRGLFGSLVNAAGSALRAVIHPSGSGYSPLGVAYQELQLSKRRRSYFTSAAVGATDVEEDTDLEASDRHQHKQQRQQVYELPPHPDQ